MTTAEFLERDLVGGGSLFVAVLLSIAFFHRKCLTKVPKVPSPRYFHACAIYGGRMVTFGV